MKSIYVPEKVNYESGTNLGKHSFIMKEIFIILGAFFVSMILGFFIYPPFRFPFYAYFVGLVYYGLAPSGDIYLKKNWEAYLIILRKDTSVYH